MDSQLQIKKQDDITIVSFRPSVALDNTVIERIEKEFAALIEKSHNLKIVLDFSSLQMISSRSLGILLGTRKKLDEHNGVLVIAGVDPKLHKVFKITHLDSLFEFYADVETAVSGLSAAE